ncbi:MAG: DedA family protein [Pyrinomonadaceae bacterium]
MSFTDQILGALSLYGLPVLFVSIFLASVGVPFIPISLMLVAAGSFAAQGTMTFWQVILVGTLAAIIGDHVGYGVSRWGGRKMVRKITNRVGGQSKIEKAEALAKKWGGAGIFLSRWLITSLGPWLNVTSGIAKYPYGHFLFWDVTGEVLWVFLYVTLGYIFSDRVQYLAELPGNLGFALLAFFVAILLGWQLVKYLRSEPEAAPEQAT